MRPPRVPPSCLSRAARLLHLGLLAGLATHNALLLAWLALGRAVGEKSVFVLMLSYLGPLLFALPLATAPWLLIGRNRRYGGLLALPVALLLWHYGPRNAPPVPAPGPPGSILTVLTHNVLYREERLELLSQTLLATGADVIALQEVSTAQQVHLARALAARYPYVAYDMRGSVSLFSRYPIESVTLLDLWPWPAQQARVNVDGTTIVVVNAHLVPPGVIPRLFRPSAARLRERAAMRGAQIELIMASVRATGLPAILACDCNMTDLTHSYARVTTELRDAFRDRGAGLGGTLLLPRALGLRSPVSLPLLRIDYLFHSPEIVARSAAVLRRGAGSDHLPVLGVFDLGGVADG